MIGYMQSYITELRGARQNSPPDFYHYSSFIPALKQKSLPLYQILKKGEFIWDKTAMRAWNDLLYLISLRIRNYIFQPQDPLICLTAASEVEQSAIITQWDKVKLN